MIFDAFIFINYQIKSSYCYKFKMQSIVKRGASINKCDSKTLNLASEILKHDLGLVAFPTETVYGLGA